MRAIELEAVADKWLCSVSRRLNHLGEQLQKVEAELAGRDIKALSTLQLHSLASDLRRQMDPAAGPVRFTSPVRELPDDEYHNQVQDWQG